MGLLSIDDVNRLSYEQFVQEFGSLFEGSPWIAAEAWEERPWPSVEALHRSLCAIMYRAGRKEQEALIRAHPDLVGQAALAGTLSRESAGEQAAAGLDRLTPEEVELFDRLNRQYRKRFGFPFVICARENKKESILEAFPRRLNNTREQEIETALGEIAKIAWLRLGDKVS